MRILKIGLVCVVVAVTASCKSARSIVGSEVVDKNMSTKQLIRENSRQDARFKTLQAKVKIDIVQDLRESSYTVNLRMERDKTIWISATLGLARAMFTPTNVKFYDKINNQYFDGDYNLISNLLGVDLNYDKVQSILIGEPLFNLKSDSYVLSTNDASYILQPLDQDPLLELFLLFNPSHFKLDSQQLLQPLKKRFLQLDYLGYQEVEKDILPQNIKIIAIEDSNELNINLEYKSITINEELRFPFKIPSGFDEILIDNAK